jgi:hypothetical protein
MSRWWMTLVVAGCGSPVAIEGRIMDGLNSQPVAGPYRIQARATSPEAAITCQLVDAEVDADGKFKIPNACQGTSYQLATDRDDLWLMDPSEVPDGGWGQPKDVVAYRVPSSGGIYKLSAGEFAPITTNADVAEHKVWKSDQKVKAPGAVPNEVTVIGPEDWLVLVGKSATAEMKFAPLVPYVGKRFFGDAGNSYSIDDWFIVGHKAVNDTTYEVQAATFDAAKVVDKARGEQSVRFVQGGALADGRYAVMKDDDRRMTLVDFGAFTSEPKVTQ